MKVIPLQAVGGSKVRDLTQHLVLEAPEPFKFRYLLSVFNQQPLNQGAHRSVRLRCTNACAPIDFVGE
jgi:hypothetical protein